MDIIIIIIEIISNVIIIIIIVLKIMIIPLFHVDFKTVYLPTTWEAESPAWNGKTSEVFMLSLSLKFFEKSYFPTIWKVAFS